MREINETSGMSEPPAQGDSQPSSIAHEEGEEGVEPVARRTEHKPSDREVEQHMLTHLPFRSWCPQCVKGKSKSSAHKDKEGRENTVPVVSVDYMYMETGEDREAKGMPIMVVKDRESRWVAARVVPKKGRDPHAVRELGRIIGYLGYKRVILKSDQEPAIKDMKEAVRAERAEDIMLEESPAYDSKSNGEVERAIQTVQGQVRTMKSALESRLSKRVDMNHPSLPWMVQHAGSLISRYLRGEDGSTAYRRLRGRDSTVQWRSSGSQSCT